ncbi:MAG: hypothetical protein AB1489_17050 [Acidobacteriota bacterium]
MSTEKPDMQPLLLPERSQIAMTDRGFEIINDGDIIVRAKVAVGSLRSLNGDIHLLPPPGEKQTISSVEAPNGVIKIIGDEFDIMEIRAKEIFCDMRSLTSKVIRAEESITLNRGRLQTNAISGRSIHFHGSEFSAQHVGAQDVIEFYGENIHGQVITGNQVKFQTRNLVRAGKIIAHAAADIEAKSVDIDYLSAQSVRVHPQTQGVIVCLDGAAPSEPNSIIGMLTPATLLEKIPALTGLIKEMQAGQTDRLLARGLSTEQNRVVHESVNAEQPPVVKESVLDEQTRVAKESLANKPADKVIDILPEPSVDGTTATASKTSIPLEKSVEESSIAEKNNILEISPPTAAEAVSIENGPAFITPDQEPLELPNFTIEPEPIFPENNLLNLTSDGAIDLGFDMNVEPPGDK